MIPNGSVRTNLTASLLRLGRYFVFSVLLGWIGFHYLIPSSSMRRVNMKHLKTARCRYLRDCISCMTKECLWIGNNSRFPCRKGYSDVDEEILHPIPTKPSDCLATEKELNLNPDLELVPRHDEFLPGWTIIVLVMLLLFIVFAAVVYYLKKQTRNVSSDVQVLFRSLE